MTAAERRRVCAVRAQLALDGLLDVLNDPAADHVERERARGRVTHALERLRLELFVQAACRAALAARTA